MSYTLMHRSHLSFLVWAQAIYLMVASPKGISSLELSEMMGISYKAAWFLTQRVRAAMATEVRASDHEIAKLAEADTSRVSPLRRKHVERYIFEDVYRAENAHLDPFERMKNLARAGSDARLMFKDVVGAKA